MAQKPGDFPEVPFGDYYNPFKKKRKAPLRALVYSSPCRGPHFSRRENGVA